MPRPPTTARCDLACARAYAGTAAASTRRGANPALPTRPQTHYGGLPPMLRPLVVATLALLAAPACKPTHTTTPPDPGAKPAPTTDDVLAASDLPPTLDAPIAGDGMGVT